MGGGCPAPPRSMRSATLLKPYFKTEAVADGASLRFAVTVHLPANCAVRFARSALYPRKMDAKKVRQACRQAYACMHAGMHAGRQAGI